MSKRTDDKKDVQISLFGGVDFSAIREREVKPKKMHYSAPFECGNVSHLPISDVSTRL